MNEIKFLNIWHPCILQSYSFTSFNDNDTCTRIPIYLSKNCVQFNFCNNLFSIDSMQLLHGKEMA